MIFRGKTSEHLQLESIDKTNCNLLSDPLESSLSILWFRSDENKLSIDGVDYVFNKDQVIFLTEFHRLESECIKDTKFLRFNRPFYCVSTNDHEVGCKGMLFFGASTLPAINIPASEVETFEILWKMFEIEMISNDGLQLDMLQTMLKRYLILCARIYKSQTEQPLERVKLDLIREFNYLVEQHYRTKHYVSDYAELLNKSPKTLSNIFSKSGYKTPLQYIQNRILLEARRLLHYSNKAIKEIAYDLGYEDIQSFSRFFKNNEGISPSEFKQNSKTGSIVKQIGKMT